MHLSEFKAWFEGFTENIKGTPNKEQWTRIKERAESITADYTPAPIFIERYIRPYRDYWPYYPTWCASGTSLAAQGGDYTLQNGYNQPALSTDDWAAAGRAEYLSAS